MAKKNQKLRVIDQKSSSVGAPLPLVQEDAPLPPQFATIPAPDTLVVTGQAIERSTQAPLVSIALSWQEAPNIAPDYYNVEWSENSSFTDVQRARAFTTSATVSGLKANGVTYYFRVQAVLRGIYSDYSDTVSEVTMNDPTEAPAVTSLSATFINGDLLITFVKPVSEIYKDAVVKIYNAGHSILYDTLYTGNQQIIWTAEQNLAATLQVGVTSVSVDVYSRSWFNIVSSAPVNTTATSAIPTTPSPTFNWTGDTGVTTADLAIAWSRASDTDSYDLILDGLSFQTRDVGYTYPYTKNMRDHTPTLASGDPSITYVLRARNKLNQQSSPASGTISNAAPPSGVMSLNVVAGFSTLGVSVALLGNTIVHDFDHYEYSLSDGSSIIQRFISPDPVTIFQVNSAGTYTPSVVMVDKFNQRSAVTSGSATVLDTLTITDLRAETTYSDSFSTNFAVVGTGMKNGVLYTGTLSDAIRYATTSGTWNWIKASRPLLDRYLTTTIAMAWPTTSRIYLEYNDGTNTVYYSGPVTVNSVGKKTLTTYASQVSARSNAISLGAAGNTGVNTAFRYDLPAIQEARNVTLWFQTDGGNFDLYEYYPRRMVESDDIRAEDISSINIRSLGINADRIFATSLSAFTASMGTLHIDSLLDIQTSGIIFQGTGSGTTLQNATTPTSFNVTGLKIFNSGGVGKLSTYNSGVEQITLDTDGRFKAGAGKVVIDANGIALTLSSSFIAQAAINWKDSLGNDIGSVYGVGVAGAHNIKIDAYSRTSENSIISFNPTSPTGKSATVSILAQSGGTQATWSVTVNESTVSPLMSFNGGATFGDYVRVEGYPTPPTGEGLELGYTGAIGYVTAYKRTDSTFKTLYLRGLNVTLWANNNAAFTADVTGNSMVANSALTNTTTNALISYHRTSGTPAAGFGSDYYVELDSSSAADRAAYLMRVTWATATDASRKARIDFFTFDTTNRLVLRMETNGSAAMIGFLGAAAIARPTVTGAKGGNAALTSVLTALANLGLITDSST